MEISRKTNIVIMFVGLVAFAGLAIFSFKLFKNSGGQVGLTIPAGEVKGIISGQSYDATVPDSIVLSSVPLVLISQDNPEITFQATSKDDGSFDFKDVPTGFSYLIKVDDTSGLASYYTPYAKEVPFPYGQKSVNIFPHLTLKEEASRDVKRQQSLYLYQSLLEEYKKDKGHYPISAGDENILSIKAQIISTLDTYLNKIHFSKDSLLDPLKSRPFVYRSGGIHYWLNAYPELITNVPLFDKSANSYLLYH